MTSRQPAMAEKAARDRLAPPLAEDVVASAGRPLDQGLARAFGARFGRDFSAVRVHVGSRAGESARQAGARAYAVGPHLVFAEGQFRPDSTAGESLLAHELAHVAQSPSVPAAGAPLRLAPAEAPEETVAERAARDPLAARAVGPSPDGRPLLRRQQPAPSAAAGPTLSVDKNTYLRLLAQALQGMSGRFVEANTLTGWVQPILQQMAGQPTWRDSAGSDTGGGTIRYTVPGTTPPVHVTLKLVLDDSIDPKDAGRFTEVGTKSGTMTVRIRKNPTADELMMTLYHESMHLMAWLINSVLPAARRTLPPSPSIRALTMSRFPTQIAGLRRRLGNLADSVNIRRKKAGKATITSAQLDRMAPWLFEEIEVRAETEVFQQFLQVQRQRAAGGRSQIFIGTMENVEVSPSRVATYVFELSKVFEPGDRPLEPNEEQELAWLADALRGAFQLQVRRQFSLTLYTQTIPRAPVDIPLTPLPKPEFRPLPTP
jgi:Domain of unknown function (DUF4157)